jgi:hypothetical protein
MLARQSTGVSAALSGLAHVFVILTAPAAMRPPASHVQSFVEMSLEERGSNKSEDGTEAEPPVSSETATAHRLPPPPRRAKKAGSAPLPRSDDAPAEAAHHAPADREPVAAALPTPSMASTPKVLNLMPMASALSTTACGMRDDRAPADCGASNNAPIAGAMERALNDSFSAAANRPAYRNQREPPKLMPAADGGYDYTDRTDGWFLLFRAHIAVDGTVRFADGARLQTAPIPIAGVFDIDNTSRHDERHTAEKRWFLEQTAELRSRLANAARAVEHRRVRRMVGNALEHIRVSSTAPKAKRDAVIELWLECDDTSGQRAFVGEWVREHMRQALSDQLAHVAAGDRHRNDAAR